MKICLINNLYKPYSKGGAERVVEMTAEGLRENGYEVFIITATPSPRHEKRELHSNDANIKIYRIWSPNLIFYGNLGKLPAPLRVLWHFLDMFNFIAAWKVRKIVKRERPDIIFLHNLKGLSYLIPKFLGNKNLVFVPHDAQLAVPSGIIFYPHLNPPPLRGGGEEGADSLSASIGTIEEDATTHISNSREWVNGVFQRINKSLFNNIKKIIFPSKWLLDFYASKGFFGQAKKVVLHNPAPPVPASLARAETLNPKFYPELGRGAEILNLLFVGQLEESKGVLFLLEVLKSLTLRHGSGIKLFNLTIVGNGSKRAQVEKLITGDERFKYLGKLQGDQLQKAYKEADFTIVPSLVYENCPTVILESFTAGTPVIASEIGGIPELMQHGKNGFLFSAGREGQLIKILENLISFDRHLLSREARKMAEIHNLDYYINNLLKFSLEEDVQNALEREHCKMCQQELQKNAH